MFSPLFIITLCVKVSLEIVIEKAISDQYYDSLDDLGIFFPGTFKGQGIESQIEVRVTSELPGRMKEDFPSETIVGRLPLDLSIKFVAVQGDYLYILQDLPGLLIYNVTSEQNPFPVGSFTNNYNGNYFIPDNESGYFSSYYGVNILNLTIPGYPDVLDSYPANSGCFGMRIVGNLLYVACVTEYLIFDVKFHKLDLVHSFSTPTTCKEVEVFDDIIILGCNDGFRIVNNSQYFSDSPRIVKYVSRGGSVIQATREENLMYVLFQTKFDIYNISDLTNPYVLDSTSGGVFTNMIKLSDEYAFLPDNANTKTLDISDPTNVVPAGFSSFDTMANYRYACISKDKKTVWLAQRAAVVSVNNTVPSSMTQIQRIQTGYYFDSSRLTVRGDRAYVIVSGEVGEGNPAIAVIDVSDRTNPRITGMVIVKKKLLKDVYVDEDQTFLIVNHLQYSPSPEFGFSVFDIRDLPRRGELYSDDPYGILYTVVYQESSVSSGFTRCGFAVYKDILFVYTIGIEVFNISDPLGGSSPPLAYLPRQSSVLYSLGYGGDIKIRVLEDDLLLAYIMTTGSRVGIVMINVTDVNDITFTELYLLYRPQCDSMWKVWIPYYHHPSGDWIAIFACDDRFEIFNTTDPTNVERLHYRSFDGSVGDPHDAVVWTSRDNHSKVIVYIPSSSGVYRFDISDLTNLSVPITSREVLQSWMNTDLTSIVYDPINDPQYMYMSSSSKRGLQIMRVGENVITGDPDSCNSTFVNLTATDDSGSVDTSFYMTYRSKGFFDEECIVYKCSGVFSNESEEIICQGHGYCPDDTIPYGICLCEPEFNQSVDCACVGPYHGEFCNLTTCNGVDSDDHEHVCYGHGSCIDFEKCVCVPENYYGEYCEITRCNGILSNETMNGCSNHGDCFEYEVCECDVNYSGESCNFTSCYGIFSNVSSNPVCSDHGDCLEYDDCTCYDYWHGDSCSFTECFGVWADEPLNVCSGKGGCNSTNECNCENDYFGDNCNITTCYGVFSNHSTDDACSNHGTCWPFEHCTCDDNYFGEYCNITMCDEYYSNDTANVCTNHGKCGPIYEECHCDEFYYGDNCNITKCNNVYSNDSNVCTGPVYGTCTFYEKCDCLENYFGEDCNVTKCDTKYSNLTFTCTEFGSCWPFDICQCDEGYFGESCNVTTCYAVYSNTTGICSEHGICWPEDSCACDISGEYFGPDCNYTWCNSEPTNISECSGFGTCWPYEVCNCDLNYYSDSCNITTCHGDFSNMSVACGSHGQCVGYDKCFCGNHYYGKKCDITTCFDVWTNDTISSSDLCSGHGNCSSYNNCSCSRFEDFKNGTLSPYYSHECGRWECFGFENNDTANVCSNHGTCDSFDHCVCSDNYTDVEDCSIWRCYGIRRDTVSLKTVIGGKSYNASDLNVCHGHGVCGSPDNCTCDPGYNTSKDCGDWTCYDVERKNHDEVCTLGLGICVYQDECVCRAGYLGEECGIYSCFNISREDTDDVCNTHGQCLEEDVCDCLNGYFDSDYLSPCDSWTCFGVLHSHEDVCSGRGNCDYFDSCTCGEYEDEDCSTWSCGVDHESPLTCSGHGLCNAPDICICDDNYSGTYCEKNMLIETVLIPTMGAFGFVVLLLLCLLALCFVISCVVCVVFVVVIVCLLCSALDILGVYLYSQKHRLRRFAKLKNLDILLEEQRLESDVSVAHIKINKKLFEIPIEEIAVEKILGEGGSSSVVYLARWKKSKVAFKCFKTRLICSSQNSFDEFEKEVAVFSSISHPNIVSFYGCTMDPPRVGIVMEFCENGEILEYIAKYREKNSEGYPVKEKIRMLVEVISSMEYLHSRSIIHRDLKTENVLLNRKEECKLMDFGLAKISERLSQVASKRIGTSLYMAPEVASGGGLYSEKCDIFGFGIFIYIIITELSNPYAHKNEGDGYGLELRVANDPNYRPKKKFLKDVLDKKLHWIVPITVSCWSHDPAGRPSFLKLGEMFEKKLERTDILNSPVVTPHKRKTDSIFETKTKIVEDDDDEEEEGKDYDVDAVIGFTNEEKSLEKMRKLEILVDVLKKGKEEVSCVVEEKEGEIKEKNQIIEKLNEKNRELLKEIRKLKNMMKDQL